MKRRARRADYRIVKHGSVVATVRHTGHCAGQYQVLETIFRTLESAGIEPHGCTVWDPEGDTWEAMGELCRYQRRGETRRALDIITGHTVRSIPPVIVPRTALRIDVRNAERDSRALWSASAPKLKQEEAPS